MAGRTGRDRKAAPEAGLPRQWVAGSVIYGSLTQVSGVAGDVTITEGRPVYHVDPVGLGRPALTVEQARQRPARLLLARYEQVGFVGRDPELRRMAGWRDDPQLVSVLLVHGTGGQGKSRLALHFARQCAAQGWRVLSARHASDPAAPPGTSGDGAAGQPGGTDAA